MVDYPPLMVHSWDPHLSKYVWSSLFPKYRSKIHWEVLISFSLRVPASVTQGWERLPFVYSQVSICCALGVFFRRFLYEKGASSISVPDLWAHSSIVANEQYSERLSHKNPRLASDLLCHWGLSWTYVLPLPPEGWICKNAQTCLVHVCWGSIPGLYAC